MFIILFLTCNCFYLYFHLFYLLVLTNEFCIEILCCIKLSSLNIFSMIISQSSLDHMIGTNVGILFLRSDFIDNSWNHLLLIWTAVKWMLRSWVYVQHTQLGLKYCCLIFTISNLENEIIWWFHYLKIKNDSQNGIVIFKTLFCLLLLSAVDQGSRTVLFIVLWTICHY